jgi:predicted N-acetyltransferase YhbS
MCLCCTIVTNKKPRAPMSRFRLQVEPMEAAGVAGSVLPAAHLMGLYQQIQQDGREGAHQVVPLVVSVRDGDGGTVGGLMASTFGEWLMLQMLWLPNEARDQGYGRRLLSMAEEEAGRRGCRHAYVDGADRVHAAFFERCGYTAAALDIAASPNFGQDFRLSKELAHAQVATQ